METLILNKEIGAAILIIAFILFGAGYAASEIQQTPTEDIESFDQFAYKAQHDVNVMMKDVIAQPIEYNLLVADNRLNNEFVDWANRESGGNKDNFIEYLAECEKIIDDMQAGNVHDASEIDVLYVQYFP